MAHPAQFGRYLVSGVLGRGGMGVVYAGHDPQIDRAVAIKTIALDALSDDERAMFESRFRAEMRSTGRLQHQNIAALYDTGREGGTAYIVMELVTGHDLKRRLASGERFSVAQALDIGLQLLAALDYAHRRQVIHRDVKPANVMLQNDGTVKLCDFGVARLTDADATRTQGMIVGSLRYASPEQISGLPIDERTDLFSTGVLLYELLSGELPFKGQSDVEVLHRIATQAAPSLRVLRPEIPAELDEAVQRALAKDPGERFDGAAAFARALGGTSPPHLVPPPLAGGTTWPSAAAQTPAPTPLMAGRSADASFATTLAVGGDRPPAASNTTAAPPAAVPTTPGHAPASAREPRHKRNTLAAGAVVLAALAAAGGWIASRPVSAPAPQAPIGAAATQPAGAEPPRAAVVDAVPVSPAAAPASTPASTPGPTLARAPAAAPAPPPAPKTPARAAVEGAWRARLACGAVLTTSGPGTEPFSVEMTIEIGGERITWTRESSTTSSTVIGKIDAQGRFTAAGQGSRKDRNDYWRETYEGRYEAGAKRLQGRGQILRARDGAVARECALAAERDAAPAVSAPVTPQTAQKAQTERPAAGPAGAAASAAPPSPSKGPAPTAPKTAAAVAVPQGPWRGEMACGPTLNPLPTSTRREPFSVKVKGEVNGERISWARDSKNANETVSGSFDAAGRFSGKGQGASIDETRATWNLQAKGQYLAREQRLEASVQFYRPKEGTQSRECTLTATLKRD